MTAPPENLCVDDQIAPRRRWRPESAFGIALLCFTLIGGCARMKEPSPPEANSETTGPEKTNPDRGDQAKGRAEKNKSKQAKSSAVAPELGHRPYGIEIIDSHVHVMPTMVALARALEVFEGAGITKFAVKSGGAPGTTRFEATVAMAKILGERFRWFCNIDWSPIDAPDFGAQAARQLERCHEAGAKGMKIFKALGLSVKTQDGKLLAVDDPRLDPLFKRAGELGMIMAMHTADPVAFFEPPTPENERWAELSIAKSWSFFGEQFPSHDALLAARDRLIARHPKTTFLLIHLANYPEKLSYVDKLLNTYPNVFVDTAARVPEMGRHPAQEVRAFFIQHQDRILFGSDFISTPRGMQLGSVWYDPNTEPQIRDAVAFYRSHWTYFETDRQQINHPTPIQGDWKVDAIALPAPVLRKLYHDNAEKLLWR